MSSRKAARWYSSRFSRRICGISTETDDDRGREVLEACTLAGLRVPTDVAVVGVDNDAVFCDLANPPRRYRYDLAS